MFMKKLIYLFMSILLVACNNQKSSTPTIEDFKYSVDKFADIEILRYRVPDFESLSLKQKELIYYLSQAALCGRDILWDQNNRYNLTIRTVLETIFKSFKGNRETPEFQQFVIYLKRVWFSSGIHHHYST